MKHQVQARKDSFKAMKNEIFSCGACPIIEDYERRLQVAQELNEECQFYYCYCKKIDDPFYIGGYCEDAWRPKEKKRPHGDRKTGRAYRRWQRRLKFERRKAVAYYGCGRGRGWLKQPYEQYLEFPKNSNRAQYYKRYSNHKVRKSDAHFGKGNSYRKSFDYLWELY